MFLTRTEIGEIFKQTKIAGDMTMSFPCPECGHPKLAAQLIKYFNEEVSRKLENVIKIRITDHQGAL